MKKTIVKKFMGYGLVGLVGAIIITALCYAIMRIRDLLSVRRQIEKLRKDVLEILNDE